MSQGCCGSAGYASGCAECAGARTARGGQLDRPEEVGGLLEVRADRVDLVDEVLHADDAILAQHLGAQRVHTSRTADVTLRCPP